MFVSFTLVLFTFSSNPFVFAFDLYSDQSPPLQISFKDWIAKWWNWWISVPQTTVIATKNSNGCLIGYSNGAALLVNPSVGDLTNNCRISSEVPIVLTPLTGECDNGSQNRFPSLAKCAEFSDEFPQIMDVKIDGISLDLLHKQNEFLVTNENFTIMIPKVNYYNATSGNFPAAAHGYFVFIKPLNEGPHTIDYNILLNNPEDNSYNFAGNIRYNLMVIKPN